MDILEEIIAYKKLEVDKNKTKLPFDKLKKIVSGSNVNNVSNIFFKALKEKTDKKQIALIAEIKKASPSKGILRKDFNHIEIANSYKKGGACCLSILTDEKYFQGNLKYIQEIKKEEVNLPVLRKDFIIDPYQIYESINSRADCILLIVAALEKDMLERLFELCCETGIDVLIEVHNEKETEIALDVISVSTHVLTLLGINNRNLTTFQTDLNTTKKLVSKYKRDLKNKIVVSESGIFTNEDIKSLAEYGVYSFLVGESLIKENDIESATKNLIRA